MAAFSNVTGAGNPAHRAAPPGRVLIIRPSALGDVCRSVAVLAALRAAYPKAVIDWLVQDSFADAVSHHPALSAVVPFPRRALADWWWRPPTTARAWSFLSDLRARRYDLVVDCQGLARSGLFAFATRAPRRIGYSNAEEFAWLFATERVRAPRDMHAVDRMMLLARSATGTPPPPASPTPATTLTPAPDLRLYAPAPDRARWAEHPVFGDARAGVFAVIAPTSRWAGKRWPSERFAEVASRLLGDGVAAVAVVGGPGEESQCEPLRRLGAADDRVVDLVGKTSVGALMALVERAAIVIANDSAVLHMAVGFDRPLVGLFGPTRLDLVGPYGREGDAIQHLRDADTFDHKHQARGNEMMRRITVDEVATAAAARVAASTRAAPVVTAARVRESPA